jgi:DNA-binding NtrC family response regulator
MIVGSEVNEQLETYLVGDGWDVLWVCDARSAIARVRRERFDLVVLISTGKEMDVMETYFNLADIRKTLLVVFVRQVEGVDNTIEDEYRVLPDSGLQSVEGMDGLIGLLSAAKAQRNLGPDQVVRNP